jgi:hypothetical protein
VQYLTLQGPEVQFLVPRVCNVSSISQFEADGPYYATDSDAFAQRDLRVTIVTDGSASGSGRCPLLGSTAGSGAVGWQASGRRGVAVRHSWGCAAGAAEESQEVRREGLPRAPPMPVGS